MRKVVVNGLMYLCGVLDHIPVFRRSPGPGREWRWTTAQWGCWPLRLSYLSVKLEQRWNLDL